VKKPTIGYAGMTHLGINSAAAGAEHGFDVVCYDPDQTRIAALTRGEIPVVEPGLPELMKKNAKRLSFTADTKKLASCDVVYISTDVPTDDKGESDLTPIEKLVSEIDAAISDDAILVILCQVPPGFSRKQRRAGPTLYYQVETLIFGRAVERAMYPERFIIGCAQPADPLPPAFAQYLESFGCPILPMRYESAELAKISINACLVSSVSVANTLAELCEEIGADWSEIVPALKLDKRIGPYSYLAPGLGLAGGNLERDLATIQNLAAEHGTDAGVVKAWVANSRHRRDWVFRTLEREVLGKIVDPVIAVLGLAYKQDTHSIKNSPSIALLEKLIEYRVRVFDPVVPASAAPNERKHGAESELDAAKGADVLIVMTPWSRFAKLNPAELMKAMRGKLVIDPYAVLDAAAIRAAGLIYATLGVAC
jgi:UDPglucose 6-dehydrogenase